MVELGTVVVNLFEAFGLGKAPAACQWKGQGGIGLIGLGVDQALAPADL
jgi:hypothetical protein